MADASRTPTLSHRLEYVATRAAVQLLRLVGWRTSSAVGALLGRWAYRPIGIRAGVTERQIAAAFPELTPAQVRDTARRSYESIGRTFVETSVLPGATREEILARFETVDGWEHLDAAIAQGKGVIVVTGHLGNWELGGAYVAARGIPLDVVARGMGNPLMEAYALETRREIGLEVVHDQQAVRQTPRSLREGRVVAMVSDHDALGLASTFVPFFGRPAKTPRGPAVFALRLGVPLVFITPVREPSGRYALRIEPVPVVETGDREADVDAIVLTYTQILERFVRRYPDQYFWQHRRWRRQPDDTPDHLREP
jgi:KDO2-lipid IV(A) lauroyltransferase